MVKKTDIHLRLKIMAHLVQHELYELREFSDHADSYFQKRIEKFWTQASKQRKRGETLDEDSIVDSIGEMRGHRNLVGAFGIIAVFSVLERYFHEVYDITRDLATIPELQDVMRQTGPKWLNFEDFRAFSKRLGVDLGNLPFDSFGLTKLQRLRNAIVHQRGIVTRGNLNVLRDFGYKLGDEVKLSSVDVKENAYLVEKTITLFNEGYRDALKAKGLIS